MEKGEEEIFFLMDYVEKNMSEILWGGFVFFLVKLLISYLKFI